MKKLSSNNIIRNIITKKIIESLKENQIPWRNDNGIPKNVISGKEYEGVNLLLLNITSESYHFSSRYWGSRNQWVALGGGVKPRPHDVHMGKWGANSFVCRSDETLTYGFLQYNLDQLEDGFNELRDESNSSRYEDADKLISLSGAKIQFKEGTEAVYHYPPEDYIIFPPKEQFLCSSGGIAGYYNSIFHELMHWTEDKLQWYGSIEIAELRAEIGADLLTSKLFLPRLKFENRSNHQKYLPKWLDMLAKDNELIFNVSVDAQKATKYLVSSLEGAKSGAGV